MVRIINYLEMEIGVICCCNWFRWWWNWWWRESEVKHGRWIRRLLWEWKEGIDRV